MTLETERAVDKTPKDWLSEALLSPQILVAS